MPRDASDLLHGTLDVLVLKALSLGPLHGYAVSEWIENNRKAKYYSLTPRGRAQLRAETATWRRYASAVGRILEAT